MSTAPSTGGDATVNPWVGARGWVTTGLVARRLGYSDRHVRRMCEQGKVAGARRQGKDGDWRIPSEWLKGELLTVVRRKPEGDEG